MKKFILVISSLYLSLLSYSQSQVNFVLVGHSDDWQLFMSKQILPDIKIAGGKVVIITFTAGDAGNANRAYGGATMPYFLAREMGSVYSSKWAADLDYATPGIMPTATTASVNGHNITKYVYQNTVNYFLRFPDGFQYGGGDPGSGSVSMQQLREGRIASLSSVDGTATYVGWTNLVNTIKAIILAEKGTDLQPWINVQSLDTVSYNYDDHSDHRTASHAGQEAVASLAYIGIRSWKDYESRNNAINLSINEHEYETGLFALCTWGESQNGYAPDFESWHFGWLNRDLSAITRNPVGNAPATLALTDPLPQTLGRAQSSLNVYMTNPISPSEKIIMQMTAVEKGELTTTIHDMAGKLVYSLNTRIIAKGRKDITLANPVLKSGVYIIKNSLNDVYIDTTKLLVE